MKDNHKLIETIEQHIKANSISCTSMTVTVFGDMVSQHGSWVWLSSLISALAPLGFNERQVRTSVYRLVQNDWLQVKKIGRCSYYCFTDSAMNHYEKVAKRLYAVKQQAWDQSWLLVLPVSVPEDKKEEFRKSLVWQGFNAITTGMYAHPSSDRSSLDEVMHELGIIKDVVVFTAKTSDLNSQGAIKELLKMRWKLSEIEVYYQNFVTFYGDLYKKVSQSAPSKQECFILRAAIIHDFRRILLRDPDFPHDMLPQGWVGHAAQDLVKRVYQLVAQPSLSYIQEDMKNELGHLPEVNEQFFTRFGGIS